MASTIEKKALPSALAQCEVPETMVENMAAETQSADPKTPPSSPSSTTSSSPTDSSPSASPSSSCSSPPSSPPHSMNLEDFEDVNYAICGLWRRDGSEGYDRFCWDSDCDHSPPFPAEPTCHDREVSPGLSSPLHDMDDDDSIATTQTCPFYNEGAVGFCWDDTCDHKPPPGYKLQEEQKDVPEPSSPLQSEDQPAICLIMGRHEKGPICDETCDNSPGAPSHYTSPYSPAPPSVSDPWTNSKSCSILGIHEKGSTCDVTCRTFSSSSDDDEEEEDPSLDAYFMKKRFRNTAVGKKRITGIVERIKAGKAKNRAGFKKSAVVLRRELISKRKLETSGLPKWKRHVVIQNSLLGL